MQMRKAGAPLGRSWHRAPVLLPLSIKKKEERKKEGEDKKNKIIIKKSSGKENWDQDKH